MPAGTVEYVIVCVAAGTIGNSVAPCSTVDGIRYAPEMRASYVIDATSQPYIDGIAVPFDYTYAAAIWALFFGFTVALWWVSKSAGAIISAVRRW